MHHALSFLLAISVSLSVGFAADAPPPRPAAQPSGTDGNTPLHLAVLRNDAEAVEALLKREADTAAINAAGVTPLHYATANERMVTALLAHGAAVNAVSKKQLVVFRAGGLFAHAPTPLGLAVLHPDSFAVVRRLIEAGADVRHHSGNEDSLILNLAITGGDRRTVELLLDHGAEVNPAEGSLPIVEAAFGGDIELVKLLLARGATVNCRVVSVEIQPLSAALLWNHYDVARLLIERGADPNARLPFTVRPPNMVLSAYNDARDPTIARMLVERGADINAVDDNGETALSYALKRGSDSPLVAYLREAGAKYSAVPRRAKIIPSRDVPDDPAGREAMVRTGVQRAIDLIQPSSTAFLQVPLVRDQQKCTCTRSAEMHLVPPTDPAQRRDEPRARARAAGRPKGIGPRAPCARERVHGWQRNRPTARSRLSADVGVWVRFRFRRLAGLRIRAQRSDRRYFPQPA
jgi:ankyrin repeat protein